MGDTTTADFSDCSVLGSVEQQSRSDFLPGEQSERTGDVAGESQHQLLAASAGTKGAGVL